jgi:hypothetical protein
MSDSKYTNLGGNPEEIISGLMDRAVDQLTVNDLEKLSGMDDSLTTIQTCAAEFAENLSLLASVGHDGKSSKSALDTEGMSNMLLALSVVIRQANMHINMARTARAELARRQRVSS